jgi:hypothetical protein
MKQLIAALLAIASLYQANLALAGTLVVHDSVGWIPNRDVSAINAEAGHWPFDLRLLIEDTRDQGALEDHAHAAVNGPNVMVIAIDPKRHRTVTRFGVSTGVKPGDYDSISQAGSAHFRSHEIRQGIEAIVARARASQEAPVAISASHTPVVIKEGLGFGAWLCIVLGGCALVGFIVWLVRKQQRDRKRFERALDDNRLETSELLSRNVHELVREDAPASGRSTNQTRTVLPEKWSTPRRRHAPTVVVAPSQVVISQPAIVQPQGGSDFATGVLVGELLGRRPAVEREVIVEREIARPELKQGLRYSNASDDAGGSSATWGGGGSSDSNPSTTPYDSGDSSSSFDAGSAGDSGRSGSFDGGGGSDGW